MEEKKKKKIKDLYEKAKIKAKAVGQWVADNKEIVIVAVPAGVAIIKLAYNGVNKAIQHHDERVLKDKRIYDRSIGRYLTLRRPLTSSEQLELTRRKENGENTAWILDDMGLLR